MDELEISGKRYISSRRAAKENKYHSDYIGQLIRAGKIIGTKVGRAWYVETGSLARYIDGEVTNSSTESQPVSQSTKDNSNNYTEHAIQVLESHDNSREVETAREQEVTVTHQDAPEEESQSLLGQVNEIHIPINTLNRKSYEVAFPVHKNTLRYVYDDTPLLPEIHNTANKNYPDRSLETQKHTSDVDATVQPVQRRKKSRSVYPTPIFVIGCLVLCIAAALSLFVSQRITIEYGKPASVGYIFIK